MPAPLHPLRLVPFLLLTLTLAAADPTPVWRALANGRPDTALRLVGDEPVSRPERLAWATAKMSRQPASDDDLRAAEAVLVDLARGDDEIAAQAEYLRARLHQLHFSVPDPAKAAEIYRALADRRPGSHWAQLGLVKLGLLELYALPAGAGAAGDPMTRAEVVLARISEPPLQRDLHLQIGEAGLVFHDPLARVLPHLLAAERIGGVSGTAREDLLVQLGVLSLRAGLPAQAKVYCERYLREYPTNVRAFTIQRKLAEAERELAKEAKP